MSKNQHKVLLHICCGPCTVFPALKLKGLKVPFDCYFYNPNINDYAERLLRFRNAVKLSKKLHFKLIKNNDEILKTTTPPANNKQDCGMCYFTRLDEVFKYAKQNNYQAVSTTLLGSPYQNQQLIAEKLELLKESYGVDYVIFNFKDGFYLGQKIARQLKIYCQKFCGCFASYQEFVQRELKKEQAIND